MRIISRFKDFYDVGQGLGHDDDIIYLREEKIIPIKNGQPRHLLWGTGIYVDIIGFCGKIIPVFVYHESGYNENSQLSNKTVIMYNYDDAEAKCRDSFKHYSRYKISKWELKQLDKYKNLNDSSYYQGYFEKYKCPLWVDTGKEIKLNTLLRNYEFYRVINPWQAWQELSMYLGNQAQPQKPIPHIDDVTMAEAKGFDRF
jgi:hypothetical protein